jgi:predicted  nucleic acid-binding Zn-ribbon protein
MGDLRELLWGLAVCDRTAEELARELTQIPGSIVEVEAKAQAARETIEQERKTLEEAEHTGRVKERELQDCEAQRAKFQSQTAMVKTNAEYTALLNEVDGLAARISQVEEEILIAMETADQISARIETVRREQTQIEQDLLRQAEQLRERMAAVKDEIDARTKQREELLARVSPEIKAHYERIRAVRGSATGQIQGQSCAACHREVPPERINRVLAGELQTCPTCQRILVAEEA